MERERFFPEAFDKTRQDNMGIPNTEDEQPSGTTKNIEKLVKEGGIDIARADGLKALAKKLGITLGKNIRENEGALTKLCPDFPRLQREAKAAKKKDQESQKAQDKETKKKACWAKNSEQVSAVAKRTGVRLTPGELQTKQWRKGQSWYKNGKYCECEIHQRGLLEKVVDQPVLKTKLRINKKTHVMQKLSEPLTRKGGFDWTEDFDGIFHAGEARYLIDFKSIVEGGGAQTRSIREINDFIEAQFNYLLNNPKDTKTRFANLLDGEILYKYTAGNYYGQCGASLLDIYDDTKYGDVKKRVYIGDMLGFAYKYVREPDITSS